LDRQSNEKKMMDYFRSKLANDQLFQDDPPICQPYFMMDISPEARMLVCRFERKQSTWSHQFVEGTIDERLIPKVAKIVAAVNATDLEAYKEEFPLDYNDGVKATFRSIFSTLKGAFAQMITQDSTPQNKHFMDYARNLGSETFDRIMDNLLELYDTPQVLLHGDYHIVNILVEDMISDEGTTSFGPDASLHICDWDTSHVGTAGRDIGTLDPYYVMKSLTSIARQLTYSFLPYNHFTRCLSCVSRHLCIFLGSTRE
jgi:aminoglycoside phosphotransferase (APT) family kinase protein